MRPMWSKSSKHSFDSLHLELSIEVTEQFSIWQHYGCYWDFGNQYQHQQQQTAIIAIIFNKKEKKCSGWKSCSFATFPNWMSFDDLRTNDGSIVIRRLLSLSRSFSITAQPICCFSIHLCYCNQIKWHSVSNLFILQYGKCDGAVARIGTNHVHFISLCSFTFLCRILLYNFSFGSDWVFSFVVQYTYSNWYHSVHICSIKNTSNKWCAASIKQLHHELQIKINLSNQVEQFQLHSHKVHRKEKKTTPTIATINDTFRKR